MFCSRNENLSSQVIFRSLPISHATGGIKKQAILWHGFCFSRVQTKPLYKRYYPL